MISEVVLVPIQTLRPRVNERFTCGVAESLQLCVVFQERDARSVETHFPSYWKIGIETDWSRSARRSCRSCRVRILHTYPNGYLLVRTNTDESGMFLRYPGGRSDFVIDIVVMVYSKTCRGNLECYWLLVSNLSSIITHKASLTSWLDRLRIFGYNASRHDQSRFASRTSSWRIGTVA